MESVVLRAVSCEVGTDPMRHAVEPFVHGSGKVAVTGDADLGKRLESYLHL